jgi:hypothetical protein
MHTEYLAFVTENQGIRHCVLKVSMTATAVGTGAASAAAGRAGDWRKTPAAFEPARRHQPLDIFALAAGTGHGVIAEYDGLELLIALGAFIFINRH